MVLFFISGAKGQKIDIVESKMWGEGTVGQNNQEYRRKYWATRSSVRSFARTAHSFACSALLALLARSAALTRLFALSLTSLTPSLVGQ